MYERGYYLLREMCFFKLCCGAVWTIQVIDKVTQGLDDYGFKCHKVMKSPIKGAASGNTEFLAHFSRVSMCLSVDEDLENDTEK